MSAVTCLVWVPRGSAKPIPVKAKFNPKDFKEYVDMNMKSETPNESVSEATENNEVENDEGMAKYNLDDYDDEENEIGIDIDTAFNEMQSTDDDDPYLDLDDDEFDDYEKSCFEIKANDNLIIVGHAEEESGFLAIYVYNEDDDDLYVHHDFLLPHIPISVEWIGCNPVDGSAGNFAAVGTVNSEISIWNLDIVDALYPDYIFGGKKKLKKRSKEQTDAFEGHSDSVLSISWNKILKNVFASASADCSICVWDLFSKCLLNKIDYHTATVQSVQWHSREPQFLLSGSTNGTVSLFDCRTPEKPTMVWKIDGEIEKVLWSRFNPYHFICSTDLGFVHIVDCRKKKVICSFEAHEEATTGLTMLSKDPNTLITTSADQSVKVWNIREKPTLVAHQKLELGAIFAVQECPDSDFLIALGGDNKSNNLLVRNIQSL